MLETDDRSTDDTFKQGFDLDDFVDGLNTSKQLSTKGLRLEIDQNRDLQEHDVLKVMMEADQPAFNARQIKRRLKTDPSRETVRRRLKDLVEIGAVNREKYGKTPLYFPDDERSDYAVPGDLGNMDVPKNVDLLDLILFREPGLYNWVGLTSIFLALYLMFLGTIFDSYIKHVVVEGTNQFVEAGAIVLIGMILLFPVAVFGQWARNYWDRNKWTE